MQVVIKGPVTGLHVQLCFEYVDSLPPVMTRCCARSVPSPLSQSQAALSAHRCALVRVGKDNFAKGLGFLSDGNQNFFVTSSRPVTRSGCMYGTTFPQYHNKGDSMER